MKKKGIKTGSKTMEIDGLKNQLARALADYDNLRKRVERERGEFEVVVLAKLVMRLLPVLDMLTHVQAHLKDQGLAIAIKEFTDSLRDEGVETIAPDKGIAFDETLHEAIEITRQEDLEDKAIVEVVLPGWRISNGIVIRPAKVKVNRKEIK